MGPLVSQPCEGTIPSERIFSGRPAVRRGHGHPAAGVMEGDRNDAHVGALAMRPGMVVGILHDGALDLVADGVHPLDAVAVLGGIEAHLTNGLLALPVLLQGLEELVPGQLLRVVDEVLDGRQGIDAGREPSEPVDTGSIQRPRDVIGVCVEVPAVLHAQVMQRGGQRSRDILGLQRQPPCSSGS